MSADKLLSPDLVKKEKPEVITLSSDTEDEKDENGVAGADASKKVEVIVLSSDEGERLPELTASRPKYINNPKKNPDGSIVIPPGYELGRKRHSTGGRGIFHCLKLSDNLTKINGPGPSAGGGGIQVGGGGGGGARPGSGDVQIGGGGGYESGSDEPSIWDINSDDEAAAAARKKRRQTKKKNRRD
ncbi:hypothetical protein AAVH_24715 [Aphelenchoides avenae]|nr:hypothetical protein AAVH_24715 [Aphelenchus avenae]